jgi:hypothetical protein
VAPRLWVGLITLLPDKLSHAFRRWMIHFGLDGAPDDCHRLFWIAAIFRLVRVGDVVDHVSDHNSPRLAFVQSPILPEADIQHNVLPLVREPHSNHFDGAMGKRFRRNSEFIRHKTTSMED